MLLRKLAQGVSQRVGHHSDEEGLPDFESLVQKGPVSPVEVVEGPSKGYDFESSGGDPLLMQVLYRRVSKMSLF